MSWIPPSYSGSLVYHRWIVSLADADCLHCRSSLEKRGIHAGEAALVLLADCPLDVTMCMQKVFFWVLVVAKVSYWIEDHLKSGVSCC